MVQYRVHSVFQCLGCFRVEAGLLHRPGNCAQCVPGPGSGGGGPRGPGEGLTAGPLGHSAGRTPAGVRELVEGSHGRLKQRNSHCCSQAPDSTITSPPELGETKSIWFNQIRDEISCVSERLEMKPAAIPGSHRTMVQ